MNVLPDLDRIVVLHDFATPEGGAGMLAIASVELYRKRGYPVTFITGEGATARLADAGADVVGLGAQGLLRAGQLTALRQGYHNNQAERLLDSWISANDTPRTVYHLHNWSQILSPSVFRPLQRVAGRTVVSCHDFFNICPNGGYVHFGKSETCTKKPMGLGCLVSQCDRRSALHKYWRIARTSHLNSLARFAKAPFTFAFLHEGLQATFSDLGFKAQDLVTVRNPAEPWTERRIEAEANPGVLFVGRVGADKGADIALEAARRAGVAITVCGTGDMLDGLKAQYPEATFAGWCNRGQIAGHARASRLLLMPSRMLEPFGLVGVEAAMAGLPVLISDTAYLAADIEHIGAGRGFPVGDVDALAAHIRELAGDKAAVARMSQLGAARGREICNTPDTWIDGFLALFARKLDN